MTEKASENDPSMPQSQSIDNTRHSEEEIQNTESHTTAGTQ